MTENEAYLFAIIDQVKQLIHSHLYMYLFKNQDIYMLQKIEYLQLFVIEHNPEDWSVKDE